jgi:hypothetical protein
MCRHPPLLLSLPHHKKQKTKKTRKAKKSKAKLRTQAYIGSPSSVPSSANGESVSGEAGPTLELDRLPRRDDCRWCAIDADGVPMPEPRTHVTTSTPQHPAQDTRHNIQHGRTSQHPTQGHPSQHPILVQLGRPIEKCGSGMGHHPRTYRDRRPPTNHYLVCASGSFTHELHTAKCVPTQH